MEKRPIKRKNCKKSCHFIPQVELLSMKEILEYFSIGERTFYRIKKNPLFPKPATFKNNIAYWDKEDLDDFLSMD